MKIYPVVHIRSPEDSYRQAKMALRAGADGIYLIDHQSADAEMTLSVLEKIKKSSPDAYVGINLLSYDMQEILCLLEQSRVIPDAVWHDDAYDCGEWSPQEAYDYKNKGRLAGIRLLGGVAFKYTQSYTDDPDKAATETAKLAPVLDVVTTSGASTGRAAPIGKLRAMRHATHKPIAIASGISTENISHYVGLVDEVLVASSIETRPLSGTFSPDALGAIIKAAHCIEHR